MFFFKVSSCFIIICLNFVLFISLNAQDSTQDEILKLEEKKQLLLKQQEEISIQLERLKLRKINEDIEKVGLPKHNFPNTQLVNHSAMSLSYDEQHEQARWVMHIVTPDVISGNLSRTNDFREDEKVLTKTAVKADYWYSGYDRGHLAPSADFRWSKTAISESYYYSNMSPQKPELNRDSWANLENWVRGHVFAVEEQMIVVSGPVLDDNLATIGENNVSIPEYYYKVILDVEGDEKKAIAFLMPNGKCTKSLLAYAVTVDQIEQLTGIDFFSNLTEELQSNLESHINPELWEKKSKNEIADVPPLSLKQRPKNTLNTEDADSDVFLDQKCTVCGKVVSTKRTQKGSVFLNFDQKFPDQIFTVTIWPNAIQNFSYSPDTELLGKLICVRGLLKRQKGTATININNEGKIKVLETK